MWEDLLAESEKQGFRIRGIWIADVAWQGQSGILNESKLGNDRELRGPPSPICSRRIVGKSVLQKVKQHS